MGVHVVGVGDKAKALKEGTRNSSDANERIAAGSATATSDRPITETNSICNGQLQDSIGSLGRGSPAGVVWQERAAVLNWEPFLGMHLLRQPRLGGTYFYFNGSGVTRNYLEWQSIFHGINHSKNLPGFTKHPFYSPINVCNLVINCVIINGDAVHCPWPMANAACSIRTNERKRRGESANPEEPCNVSTN